MGRPRKPTAQLELVGAFKKNPQRARESEPVCGEEVGEAPDRLSKTQQEAWDYIVHSCVPGVLTKMDRVYLELCSIALAYVWGWNAARQGRESEFEAKDIALNSVSLKDVGAMLGKLGMTPSERSKVVVPKKEKANPFAAYRKA